MNTIEGAMVFTALAVVTGTVIAGFGSLSSAHAAQSLARDGARAAAMGEDATQLIRSREAHAQVHVTKGGEQTVAVKVTLPSPLMDVSAEAVTLIEPTE